MSSLNIKQDRDSEFTVYPQTTVNGNEIDLVTIEILWRARTKIIATVFAFVRIGLLVSFLLPQKWTSEAVVTPAEPVQWQELENTLTKLRSTWTLASAVGMCLTCLSKIPVSITFGRISALFTLCIRTIEGCRFRRNGSSSGDRKAQCEKMTAVDSNLSKK